MAGAFNPHHAEHVTDTIDMLRNYSHSPHAQVKEIGSVSHNGPQGEFNNTMDTVTMVQKFKFPKDQVQVKLQTNIPFTLGPTSSSRSTKPKLKKYA